MISRERADLASSLSLLAGAQSRVAPVGHVPASGTVTLPLRLFWSPAGRVFDLDDPFMLRSMYQVVLGEAIRAEELTTYLNRDRLLSVWRDLYLPKGVRQAWEELHLALRSAAPAPAA